MQLHSFLSLLSMQIAVGAAFTIPTGTLMKRKPETNATLFAYGANSSAWPIAYGLNDGLLYISQTPDNITTNIQLTPITWDLPSITGENWIVNGTFVNGTTAGSMFIKPEDSNAVGVMNMTRIAYNNTSVTGFALFATQLVYNNNSQLEAQFWAELTDVDGIYALVWNSDGDVTDGSFPVVVKGVEY
ncbi:uncharacterized protein BCR38DRAFT_394118 [Pseudomassariella vexata]|uniref:Glycoside hydrolase family 12 protein n=1 Tax=Pseudomassariella vexata TaxID=1141098 RepID=A0A1Y2DVR0_9PEZI|nr:uncharacterized protein BCR38DRAFT_394118 [Pseudomassariella vexata]ORY63279.1 hypothetical protein BCR38DRAFT_394118 [Pseudomassariella vexata]